MAGGRFGSALVYPYTTSKVWENQCSAAASITVTGTSLDENAQKVSLSISDQNICGTCCTLLGTSPSTYNYNDVTGIYYINSTYEGMTCDNPTQVSCFRPLAYVDCSNNSFFTCGFSGPINYYSPVPYISTTTIPNTGYSAGGCTVYATVIPVGNCNFQALIDVRCLSSAGGCVPYSCPLKNLLSTNCAVACLCCTFQETTGSVGCGVLCYQGLPNASATDYWGVFKGSASLSTSFVGYTVGLCETPSCYCLQCCTPSTRMCSCCKCQCCTLFYCITGSWTTINCMCNTTLYPCIDKWYAQRLISAGCNMFMVQLPLANAYQCNLTIFRGVCCSDRNCLENAVQSGNYFMLKTSNTDGVLGGRWATYNHKTGKNVFMWFHSDTPDWNGIYELTHSCVLNNTVSVCCCVTYPDAMPPGITKIADVPAAWCCIGSSNLTTTTPVAFSDTEFMVRVGHLANGLTGCMTRYTTGDFITWNQTNESYYGSCISANTAIIGNTTHTYHAVNNFSALDKTSLIENCTCALNIERTGIVVSDGDSIYVTNHTSTPMAFTAWGYTE